jgi:hypothetical protein
LEQDSIGRFLAENVTVPVDEVEAVKVTIDPFCSAPEIPSEMMPVATLTVIVID